MRSQALRAKLEELRTEAEKSSGVWDKAALLKWAYSVAPLLKFNQEYYRLFVEALNDLLSPLHAASVVPRWQLMLGQLDQAIAEIQYLEEGLSTQRDPVKLLTSHGAYIDPQRIKELENLTSTKHDLKKLLRLLTELNLCHENQCYFAIATLIRTLLDHVPPILGMNSFKEVANNYSGTKSFRESMLHLENTARKIADQHLHTPIRTKEVLPNFTQVDFSNNLDVLLSEIVRLQK